MGKLSPWVKRNRTPIEDAEEIARFLANGGKVIKLKDGEDSAYDKNLKKIQKELMGGFNPFTKEESLKVEDQILGFTKDDPEYDEWLKKQVLNRGIVVTPFEQAKAAWDRSPMRHVKPCEVVGPLPVKIGDFDHYEWWRKFYRRDYYRTY